MADETAQQQQDSATDAEAGGPDMVPAEQVKAALEAAGDFKDKLLRALAEMENLRKRTEREVADARIYGVTSFARDVLQVADNMHRALDAIGDELRETADSKVSALLEGIDLTERELTKVLEKHGVKMFSPLGEKFDPEFSSGDVRSPRSRGDARHGRAGDPGGLPDRRAGIASGHGRDSKGAAKGRGCRQRKFFRLSNLPRQHFRDTLPISAECYNITLCGRGR